MARLGEHDTEKDDDGAVQDINIIFSERHPYFNKQDGTNDVAILHLEYDAEFSSE